MDVIWSLKHVVIYVNMCRIKSDPRCGILSFFFLLWHRAQFKLIDVEYHDESRTIKRFIMTQDTIFLVFLYAGWKPKISILDICCQFILIVLSWPCKQKIEWKELYFVAVPSKVKHALKMNTWKVDFHINLKKLLRFSRGLIKTMVLLAVLSRDIFIKNTSVVIGKLFLLHRFHLYT